MEKTMEILVCYDRTEASKKALETATKHAKVFDANLHLLTSYGGGVTKDSRDEKYERIWKDVITAEEELESLKEGLKDTGITCFTHVSARRLSPGEDILQFAQDNNIDEIFIGIEKKSKVGKLLFGSTAQYVILGSDCPVVTVR